VVGETAGSCLASDAPRPGAPSRPRHRLRCPSRSSPARAGRKEEWARRRRWEKSRLAAPRLRLGARRSWWERPQGAASPQTPPGREPRPAPFTDCGVRHEALPPALGGRRNGLGGVGGKSHGWPRLGFGSARGVRVGRDRRELPRLRRPPAGSPVPPPSPGVESGRTPLPRWERGEWNRRCCHPRGRRPRVPSSLPICHPERTRRIWAGGRRRSPPHCPVQSWSSRLIPVRFPTNPVRSHRPDLRPYGKLSEDAPPGNVKPPGGPRPTLRLRARKGAVSAGRSLGRRHGAGARPTAGTSRRGAAFPVEGHDRGMRAREPTSGRKPPVLPGRGRRSPEPLVGRSFPPPDPSPSLPSAALRTGRMTGQGSWLVGRGEPPTTRRRTRLPERAASRYPS
jgi:hypothetical protein